MATQATLLTSLRDRLDEPTAKFWTDAQLRKWINDGARDLSRKTECNQTRADIAVTGGTQEYSMPTDVIRVYRVEWVRTGDTNVYALEFRDFNNMDEVWYTSQTVNRANPYYFTMWGMPPTLKLMLYPTPDVNGTAKVFYYKFPADLATDGTAAASTVDVPGGWEDCVVDFAEYMALRKDGNQQWQEAKQLYDEKVADLYATVTRWSDQMGTVVSGGGAMVPNWLYGDA